MTRVVLALAAVLGLTAFAPAPFPRSRAVRGDLSLEACSGTWEVVRKESISGGGVRQPHTWGVTHVRIRDDRWTLLNQDAEVATYSLAIDGRSRPATIDWHPAEGDRGRPLWAGLLKRDGDRLLVLYNDGVGKRAEDFEHAPSGSFLITLQKGR